ncbi:MAG: MATE family efflux transporter [Acidimicrobiia bacterium]
MPGAKRRPEQTISTGRDYDRDIVRLAVPAFGALMAEPVYILVDTAVVGHLGTPQLGGLAVASSALLTGYALFVVLAYGTTATVARLSGAGDDQEAARQGLQGLWLALFVSVPLTAVAALGARPIVEALGAAGDVAVNAEIYLRLSAPGIPALLLVLAGTGYLRGRLDTRTPLAVAVGSNVANLGLEVLFVYGLGLGIGASATATVVAQWGAAVVYLVVIGRQVWADAIGLRPDRRSVLALARSGRDLLVRTAALRAALLVGTVIATRLGPDDIAAHQVALQVFSLLTFALDAIAIAGQALVGTALGAGRRDDAVAVSRRMLRWGLVGGCLLGTAVLAARPWLPQLFSDDPKVTALAGFLLVAVALLQPVSGVVFALDGILIGAGDQRFLAVAMVGAFAAFAVVAGAASAADSGIGWLWAAIGVLMVARLVPLYVRFRRGHWAVAGAWR